MRLSIFHDRNEEGIELLEFRHPRVRIDGLKEKMTNIETCKKDILKDICLIRGQLEDLSLSDCFTFFDFVRVIVSHKWTIRELEKLMVRLDSAMWDARSELARLENPSDQSQPQEPNYYPEVMMCRMQ